MRRRVFGRVNVTTAQQLFQRKFDIYRTHQPLENLHPGAFAGYKVSAVAHAMLHHIPHQIERCLLAIVVHLASANVYKDVLRWPLISAAVGQPTLVQNRISVLGKNSRILVDVVGHFRGG